MPTLPTLDTLDLSGKKVLVRVDFNVPLDKEGKISDDTRIRAALPTIQYILAHNAAVILMSHLGRPKGKINPAFSLKSCAKRLAELLQQPVEMAPDCVGKETEELAQKLQSNKILLLENLRFHPEEENPTEEAHFSKQLATLADLYVNDAFGTAHRTHSSTTQIVRFFPQRAAVGFLMEKEVRYLGEALKNPKRPFVAILGGAKISTKLGVIHTLKDKADTLLIGGGMSYTFLKASGVEIGKSLYEEEKLEEAKALLHTPTLQLPLDLVLTDEIQPPHHTQLAPFNQPIPPHLEGVDIGPQTIQLFCEKLSQAKTIFWNGPVGVFEHPPFDKGTLAIATCLSQLKNVTTIVGGGDSIAALKQMGLSDQISHISTGGGAALKYIEKETLPAIKSLF